MPRLRLLREIKIEFTPVMFDCRGSVSTSS